MWRVLFFCLLLVPGRGMAEPEPQGGAMCSSGAFGQVQCIRPAHFVHDVCQALAAFSADHGLDPGFFTRLIWQESRFDPNALSHADAMGIAQFIASTAELRGLTDPYNPAMALEHSAEYLGELSRRYGNHGLAAVAYNGGERRANGLVAKTGGLARETVNYVRIITGLSAETWRDAPPEAPDFALDPEKPFREACHDLGQNRRLTALQLQPGEPDVPKWGVQMAFGVTERAALDKFRQASRGCRRVVGGEEPHLVWAKSRASPQGGYYMARLGRDSRDDAWRLCSRIKRSGCVCAVYKNF